MSFSEEWKWELTEEEKPRTPCCRKAFLTGLLYPAQVQSGVFCLYLPGERIAEALIKDVHRVYPIDVKTQKITRAGHPYTEMRLAHPGTLSLLQRADLSDLPMTQLMGFGCENCMRYFLRGVCIGCGTMSDPAKEHHLELTFASRTEAARIATLMEKASCNTKTVKRGEKTALYMKNSAWIEDFLSFLHAPRSLFALINTKIERDIRNNENRATNCVTQNIQKAVAAASAQAELFARLRNDSAWDRLPESLRVTAQMRMDNEEMTLPELAAAHNPPLTKSGLHHRLQKLTEYCREYLKTDGEE